MAKAVVLLFSRAADVGFFSGVPQPPPPWRIRSPASFFGRGEKDFWRGQWAVCACINKASMRANELSGCGNDFLCVGPRAEVEQTAACDHQKACYSRLSDKEWIARIQKGD